MTHMPEEKTFKGKSTKLNYLDWGSSSAEPLVMLHGGAWSWREYLSLIPSLAQAWHIYAPDFRGNGRSGWVPGSYRLRDFADDNAQFLGQLKAPAVLAGHSLGGVVALMLAARCPDRMKALILEDPAFGTWPGFEPGDDLTLEAWAPVTIQPWMTNGAGPHGGYFAPTVLPLPEGKEARYEEAV